MTPIKPQTAGKLVNNRSENGVFEYRLVAESGLLLLVDRTAVCCDWSGAVYDAAFE